MHDVKVKHSRRFGSIIGNSRFTILMTVQTSGKINRASHGLFLNCLTVGKMYPLYGTVFDAFSQINQMRRLLEWSHAYFVGDI